eukprot:Pgem_evm1s10903
MKNMRELEGKYGLNQRKANFEGNIQALSEGVCYLEENAFRWRDTTLTSTSQVESIVSIPSVIK